MKNKNYKGEKIEETAQTGNNDGNIYEYLRTYDGGSSGDRSSSVNRYSTSSLSQW